MRLAGEEDVSPPFAERGTIIVHAAVVGRSGVAVGNTLAQCPLDDSDSLGGTAMRTQDSLAAQAEERDRLASPAKEAARQRGVRPDVDGSGHVCPRLQVG